MTHYFLAADMQALEEQITSLKAKISAIGAEMGRSCQEGAETFHDNFAYEEGERQQTMWSRRLRELVRIREQAKVIQLPASAERVSIGRHVVMRDVDTGEERVLRIGSFLVLASWDKPDYISYHSPLARLLIGAEEGEQREGVIGGRTMRLEVLQVL